VPTITASSITSCIIDTYVMSHLVYMVHNML